MNTEKIEKKFFSVKASRKWIPKDFYDYLKT